MNGRNKELLLLLQCYHNPNTWSWVQASVLAKDARVGVGKAGTEQGGKGCKGCEVKSAKPVFLLIDLI